MDFVVNVLIVVASLILLYYAYFKKSELGKLAIFVVVASMLLQEFVSILGSLDLFDFMSSILSTLGTIIVYGEVIVLILLLVRFFAKTNQVLKASMIIVVVLKVIAVLGIL